MFGALTGSSLGGLAAIALTPLMIAFLGPMVAIGSLLVLVAEAFSGAMAGGVAGLLLGGLVGSWFSNPGASSYQNELNAGRILVSVNAGDREQLARAVLREHGASDIHMAGARNHLTGQARV